MKKTILILIILIIVSGCTRIDNASPNDLIKTVQENNILLSNQHRKGYKYYLPTGLTSLNIDKQNEILSQKNLKYYLYVDLVSYINEIKLDYKINEEAYISTQITHNEVEGYLEVTKLDNQYLIEIMYNYAKIELIVNDDDLNTAITNSIIILSSITYNDEIIESMMGEDILSFSEEKLDIFEVRASESNFLEYLEEFDTYDDLEIPDIDLIN